MEEECENSNLKNLKKEIKKTKELTFMLERRIFDLCKEKDILTENNLLREQWERLKMVEELSLIEEFEEIEKEVLELSFSNSKEQTLSSLQCQLLQKASENLELKNLLNNRDKLLFQMKTQHDTMKEILEKEKNETHKLRTENSNLQKENETLISDFQTQKQINSNKQELSLIQAELQEKNHKLQEYESKIALLEDNYEIIQEENTSFKRKISENLHSIKELESQVSMLTDILNQKEEMLRMNAKDNAQILVLEKELSRKNEMLLEMNNELKKVSGYFESLNSQIRQKEQDIRELNCKQNETQKEFQEISKDKERLKLTLANLEGKNEEKAKELEELKEKTKFLNVHKGFDIYLEQIEILLDEKENLLKKNLELEQNIIETRFLSLKMKNSNAILKKETGCQTAPIYNLKFNESLEVSVLADADEHYDEKDRIIREFERQNSLLMKECSSLREQNVKEPSTSNNLLQIIESFERKLLEKDQLLEKERELYQQRTFEAVSSSEIANSKEKRFLELTIRLENEEQMNAQLISKMKFLEEKFISLDEELKEKERLCKDGNLDTIERLKISLQEKSNEISWLRSRLQEVSNKNSFSNPHVISPLRMNRTTVNRHSPISTACKRSRSPAKSFYGKYDLTKISTGLGHNSVNQVSFIKPPFAFDIKDNSYF